MCLLLFWLLLFTYSMFYQDGLEVRILVGSVKKNYGSRKNLTGLSGLLSETPTLSHPELFLRMERKGGIPSLPTETSCLYAYQPIQH